MSVRRTLGVAVLLAAGSVGLMIACDVQAGITGYGAAAELVAVCGSSIEIIDLDGTIGSEWDDAAAHELLLGRYQAEVLLEHDGLRLYVGMIISTARRFSEGFEAFAVFDNSDGVTYSRGDDALLAQPDDGALVDADYYYHGTYDFRRTRWGGRPGQRLRSGPLSQRGPTLRVCVHQRHRFGGHLGRCAQLRCGRANGLRLGELLRSRR
jgi:hypothetical protein